MGYIWNFGLVIGLTLIAHVCSYKEITDDRDRFSAVIRSNMNMVNLLALSRSARDVHSDRASACFNHYLPIFVDISKHYEEEYGMCLEYATHDTSSAKKGITPRRKEMTEGTKTICSAFDACNSQNNLTDFFDCYWKAGKNDSVRLYTIATNSSDSFNELTESYHQVEVDRIHCLKCAERKAVIDSAKAHGELESCLKGETEVPDDKVFNWVKPSADDIAPTAISTSTTVADN